MNGRVETEICNKGLTYFGAISEYRVSGGWEPVA